MSWTVTIGWRLEIEGADNLTEAQVREVLEADWKRAGLAAMRRHAVLVPYFEVRRTRVRDRIARAWKDAWKETRWR